MASKYELPFLDQIFETLQSGKHISFQDGDLYFAVQDKPDDYTQLFAALGFELISHQKEFYYFRLRGKANNDSTKQLALFIFLLIEHLDSRVDDLESALLEERFYIETLPHLKTERYRELMREVKVNDASGIQSVIKNMEKYGIVTTHNSSSFSFRSPVYRFLDICAEQAIADNSDPVLEEV